MILPPKLVFLHHAAAGDGLNATHKRVSLLQVEGKHTTGAASIREVHSHSRVCARACVRCVAFF